MWLGTAALVAAAYAGIVILVAVAAGPGAGILFVAGALVPALLVLGVDKLRRE